MFSTDFNHGEHRRVIAGTEMIVNCEHYNARLQSVIEGTPGLPGENIWRQAAERAAAAALTKLFGELTPESTKLALVAEYYSNVGLGILHFDKIGSDVVEQSSSMFVKGWKANFPGVDRKTCSYAEGFLQGAYFAIYGEPVEVKETACMHSGAARCQFRIKHGRTTAVKPIRMKDQELYRKNRRAKAGDRPRLTSDTVNDEMITAGVLAHMPLNGNQEGLCPVFIQQDGRPGAHLSSVPMDFYSLLFTEYTEQMNKAGRSEEARIRLIGSAEACSYYTWGKVLTSHEWHGMIDPMVKSTEDKIFGLIALSNMLGRGKWSVVDFKPGERLEVESFNNFESESYERLDYRPRACSCSAMNGTATAYMNLVYPAHLLNAEGIGDFKTTEISCIARGDDRCRFVSERRKMTQAEIDAQDGPDGLSCSI